MTDPELVADCRCRTGEGPLWHPDQRVVYWIDIPAGLLYRYDPRTAECEECYRGEPIGGITIQEDGALLLFQQHCAVRLWQEGEVRTVLPEYHPERGTRFNDCIADPAGRVFAGTMPAPDHPSRLYRLSEAGAPVLLIDGAAESNGMGFSPELDRIYWTDTHRRTIFEFEYDAQSGRLGNRRVFARIPDEPGEGIPDGLTVDGEGSVWSARWGGGCVVRYSPEGEEDGRIRLPALQVSSLTFGGEELEDLYITTSGGEDPSQHGPGSGALFRVRPGVRGKRPFRSRITQLAAV